MKKLFLIVTCLFLFGCTSKNANQNSIPAAPVKQSDTTQENFDVFFKKFQTDSVFQKSRIEFPLKSTTIDEDGNSKKSISKDEWIKNKWTFIHFFATYKSKEIIKKTSLGQTKLEINFQVEDTGIERHFLFVKVKGKWELNSVEDLSD